MNLGKNAIKVGEKVAVVGGGNSAIDAARTALETWREEGHHSLPPSQGRHARCG